MKLNLHIQFPKIFCNFNCSYCFQRKHYLPTETQKKTVEKKYKLYLTYLNNLYNKSSYNSCVLTLLGGEITLYDLNYIFSALKSEKKIILKIMTNLAKDISYYKNLFENNKNLDFLFNVSYHKEFLNFDVYKKKMLEISSFGFENLKKIKTSLVISNSTPLELINDLKDFSYKTGFSLRFITQENKAKMVKLKDEYKQFYEVKKIKRKKINEITKKMYEENQVYNLKDSICIPEFTIDESGEIRPECNTYWPNPKKYIFSINSLEELLNKKMVCTVNRCPCLNFIYNSLNDND